MSRRFRQLLSPTPGTQPFWWAKPDIVIADSYEVFRTFLIDNYVGEGRGDAFLSYRKIAPQ